MYRKVQADEISQPALEILKSDHFMSRKSLHVVIDLLAQDFSSNYGYDAKSPTWKDARTRVPGGERTRPTSSFGGYVQNKFRYEFLRIL